MRTGRDSPCLGIGIPIDAGHRLAQWPASLFPVDTTRFVPLFAYEAVLNLVGLAVLLLVGRWLARRLYDGDIALLYLAWYGAVRSFLNLYRPDNWMIGPLPTSTWLGIAGVVAGIGLLVLRHVRGWGTPGAWMHREAADEVEADGAAEHGTPPESEPSAG